MTCNCEFGLPCSTVSNCYLDQELADKQEDIDSLRAELATLKARLAEAERDTRRLSWLDAWITDNSSGLEIYPIGPDEEYGPDGNTVVRVVSYALADKTWPGCQNLREAIDAVMASPTDREDA